MNYHNITKDDMLNGEGLRVVLWLSGCSHHCDGCQNPETWNPDSGVVFDESAKEELFEQLGKDYISGITFSGGDPLNENNLAGVISLISEIRERFSDKTIWLYSGSTLQEILKSDDKLRKQIVLSVDIFVDGKFEKDKADISYPWGGSTNQKVNDMKKYW